MSCELASGTQAGKAVKRCPQAGKAVKRCPLPYFEVYALKIVDHEKSVEVDGGGHEGGTCRNI